ncbi:hypothetical protein MRB53_020937 [Persea americana]|uniref:Uncharacterized protein n=1 Tax=Persea americana TaxID=3435 RepID=A0ACC2L2I5_PERAE|nr:hypothetical protein MRB53_020937 [Persea americana]
MGQINSMISSENSPRCSKLECWHPPALQRGDSAQTPSPLRLNAWQNPAAPRQNPMMDPRAKMWIPRRPPRPNPGGVGRGTDDCLAGETPAHELQQLKLSPATSKTPSEVPTITRVPMTRPDGGGKDCEQQMELLVNHFKLEFNPNSNIFHHDIDIKLEKPTNPNAVVRVSKSDAVSVINKLFSEELSSFPISKTAYDGEKNIYSAVELPTGKFNVTISKGEETRPQTYTVSVKLVNKLELGVLDAYPTRNGYCYA